MARKQPASQSFVYLLGSAPTRDVAVRLWDGTTWKPQPAEPTRCTLVLRHPGALRRMFMPPNELRLGEAYIYDDFDIEGEIEAVVPLIRHFLDDRRTMLQQLRYGQRLLSLPKLGRARGSDAAAKLNGPLHSKERDRQATRSRPVFMLPVVKVIFTASPSAL